MLADSGTEEKSFASLACIDIKRVVKLAPGTGLFDNEKLSCNYFEGATSFDSSSVFPRVILKGSVTKAYTELMRGPPVVSLYHEFPVC